METVLKLNPDQKIYFTSDLHIGSKHVIEFCHRPFSSIEEMNKALIENWNNTVDDDSIIFNLGDFIFGSNRMWRYVIPRLKGKHYLILGNHDYKNYPGDQIMSMFEWWGDELRIKIGDRIVLLNHYPLLCYAGTYRKPENAVWQLFGHIHSPAKGRDTNRLQYLFPYQYDVGVDNNDYKPVSWEKVCEIINSQVKAQKL